MRRIKIGLFTVVTLILVISLLPGLALAAIDESSENLSIDESEGLLAQSNLEAQGTGQQTTKTADEAIAWANSKVGLAIDYDGAYGAQCVDFIKAYYAYLGMDASKVSGNAKDYATNYCFGWERIQGGVPQRGDILVYSVSSNGYGHVAIFDSDSSIYEQNYNECRKVEHHTWKYNSGYEPGYWGVIRPNWKSSGHNPEGYLDVATGGDGTVTVRGWAFDRDNINANLSIHIYVGGSAGSGAPGYGWIVADKSRPDVNKAYGVSGNHGFEATIKTDKRGTLNIYAYAINTGAGSGNTLLVNSPYSATILEPVGDAATIAEGTYAIRTKMDTSMGLDVSGASKDDKANVWLYKWNSTQSSGSTCQKYSIQSAGDGSYYVIATHSNKAVEVYGASTANGANVSQYALNKSVCQRWLFDKNSDGTYTLRNRASGLVMDVEGEKTSDRTNIIQGKSHDGDNQKFYLVPTDASRWDVKLSSASVKYSGNEQKPGVSVSAGGVAMKEGSDYTVSYKDNVKVGTATVTMTAKGGYSGSKNATFEITSASSNQDNGKSDNGSGGGSEKKSGSASSKSGSGKNSSGNSSSGQSMHRLYNPNSGEHFYTSDDAEFDNLVGLGWNDEGEGWTAPSTSNIPVYRVYNPNAGEHHYTLDASERDMLIEAGWNDEGIGWYSASGNGIPLFREYNPNEFANNHNYTADREEHNYLISIGWQDEGIAWFGV